MENKEITNVTRIDFKVENTECQIEIDKDTKSLIHVKIGDDYTFGHDGLDKLHAASKCLEVFMEVVGIKLKTK